MNVHEAQIDVSESQVAALVADQSPQGRGAVVRKLDVSGTENAIFRVGDSFAARLPIHRDDPGSVNERLQTQARRMTEFRQVSAVPGPDPLFVGKPGHGYPLPWSVQTWIDGHTASPTSNATSYSFAEDLAALIRSLRAADTRDRQFDGENRGGDLAAHDAWVHECLTRSRGILDTEALGTIWTRLRELPREDPDVMSHSDLIPTNLLVADGGLVGVLDTGDFGAADPALDLVCGWHLLDHGPRDVLRKDLACSDLQWERSIAWAFEQAIGLVWYYQDTNPAMALLGRTTLTRILEHHHS